MPHSSKSNLPPLPYGPLPTIRQLAQHRREFYGFIHFTSGRAGLHFSQTG
jgi:hypothetical protein